MKPMYVIVLVFSMVFTSKAQDISSVSNALFDLKVDLENHPESSELQEKYIANFPSTAVEFENLFYNKESVLYGKEISYSMIFMKLIDNNPREIGQKLLNICTYFSEDYLAHHNLGGLRYPILHYILKYSEDFMALYRKMPYEKQTQLIEYLADVENHESYRDYQDVIDKFQLLDKDIAQLFEKYRALRQKRGH